MSGLLHYDSSKNCGYPLFKFVCSFKVVNIFLKHSVLCVLLHHKRLFWSMELVTGALYYEKHTAYKLCNPF
jgi:hypothetical protein